VIIEYEGERYEFEFDDITVKQAIKIEKHTGVKLTDWGEQLAAGNDWLALQALGWLVLFAGKGAVDDADFKVGPLASAFATAINDQAEKAAAADAPVPTAAVPASNGQSPAAEEPGLSLASSAPALP